MQVVGISLDPKVLEATSTPSERNRLYGTITDHYRVIVHHHKDTMLELTPTVTVYGVGGRIKAVRFFRIALLLRRLIKAGKCDVITSSDPYFLGALSYFVARMYGVGYESHILGIEKLNPIRKAVAAFFVKRAGAVRVNSTRLRERVAREFGVPQARITFVPIYVPTEKLGFKLAVPGSKERAEQDSLTADFTAKYEQYFNFLFIGRLVEVKNVALQITAMKQVVAQHPQARLHIVGDGDLRPALAEQVHNLGLTEAVVFHGRQEGFALGTFYRECDSFLLTSFSEGWPMVIYEAMTAGLAIIMTDVGCAGEMIKDGANGLVVPVDDAAALAAAMTRVIADDTLRTSLVQTATDNIKNYWPKEQILNGYRQSWETAYKNR